MTVLKLCRLPDRTPVKVTFVATPDLNQDLLDYAELYRETYGQTEQVANLIPHMLQAFLDSDRGFAKKRNRPS